MWQKGVAHLLLVSLVSSFFSRLPPFCFKRPTINNEPHTQVVEAQQFGKDAIDVIFAEAERMEKVKPGRVLLMQAAACLYCLHGGVLQEELALRASGVVRAVCVIRLTLHTPW